MPFQSEKQRRFLHANHPEIAKRWEKAYAHGGITLPEGPAGITSLNGWGSKDSSQNKAGVDISPSMDKNPNDPGWGGGQDNQDDGDGPKPHLGPTLAEILAQKKAAADLATANAKKRRDEEQAAIYADTMKRKAKKKSKVEKFHGVVEGELKKVPISYIKKKIGENIIGATTTGFLPYMLGSSVYGLGKKILGPKKTKTIDDQSSLIEVDTDYKDIEGHRAEVTDKQKDVIGSRINLLNRGLIDTKTVYDNTKIFDDKGSKGFWGMGVKEAEPMSIKEFNKEIKKQGYTGTDFIPEVTAVGAEGGIANHFKRKKFNTGSEPVIGDALFRPWSEYSNEHLQMMFPDWDPEIESIDEHIKNKQSINADFAAVTEGNGILDIDASEEIISEDGNDIELTAYNAAFDDPKDLSAGVKTLFQAKNGGSYEMQGGVKNYLGEQEMVHAPKHWQSAPDHPETELAYITKPEKDLLVKSDLHGSLHGSVNKGPQGLASLNGWGDAGDFDGPSSSTGGGAPPGEKGGPGYVAPTRSRIQKDREEDERKKAEDERKKAMAKTIAIGPGSAEEKYDTWEQEFQDIPGTLEGPQTSLYKNKVNVIHTRDIYEDALATQKQKMKKMGLSKLIMPAIMIALGVPPSVALKSITVNPKDLMTAVKHSLPVAKAKKELIEALGLQKGALLGQVDILNPNEMKSEIGTNISDITNEINNLTKPKDKEDDTGGDGPEPPKVVPVHEEIQEYEDTASGMSSWDRIKANQAKRALLVEKGIIQDNPIVDESVTDITMQANKGGLANLFRVKNNQ